MIFDSHVDHDVGIFNYIMMTDHQSIPNEVLAGMHNEEDDDICVDSDELDSNLILMMVIVNPRNFHCSTQCRIKES